ncbi:unnamed protein product [Rhizophagus irregularis]|nr:unnamed protein product [Rhizophagus irregularis]
MSNVIPPQSKMNHHNVTINQRRKFPRQQYKQLLIRFEKGTVVKYLYEQSIWNIMIENFSIANYSRQSQPRRIQETYIYKITGIQLNTDSRNIEPLITHIKRTILKHDKEVTDNYNHIIQLNKNSTTNNNQKHTKSTKRGNIPTYNNSDFIDLKEKYNKLETLYKFLDNKYQELEKKIAKREGTQTNANEKVSELRTNMNQLTKDVDSYKQAQTAINDKLDFIISKINFIPSKTEEPEPRTEEFYEKEDEEMTEDNGDDDTDTLFHNTTRYTEVKKTGIFGFYR